MSIMELGAIGEFIAAFAVSVDTSKTNKCLIRSPFVHLIRHPCSLVRDKRHVDAAVSRSTAPDHPLDARRDRFKSESGEYAADDGAHARLEAEGITDHVHDELLQPNEHDDHHARGRADDCRFAQHQT